MSLPLCDYFAGRVGNDPATDLRGSGFLSLLQLLCFVTEPKSQPLAQDVYRLSLSEDQASVALAVRCRIVITKCTYTTRRFLRLLSFLHIVTTKMCSFSQHFVNDVN